MGDANWWLIAVAFVLGLLLTFALMIRPVTQEIPANRIGAALHTGRPAAEADPPTTNITTDERAPTTTISTPKEEPPTAQMPAAGAAAYEAEGASESKTTKMPVAPEAPRGAGSARAGCSGPSGWLSSEGRMTHYPGELRHNADFANARIDALQAALAALLARDTPDLERRYLEAFQGLDRQLAEKWSDIKSVRDKS
jgi:uncharacterized membrane protein ArfC